MLDESIKVPNGRDEARGERTLEEIRAQTGNTRLRWYRADFSQLSQVRALAEVFLAVHFGQYARGMDSRLHIASNTPPESAR